MKSIFQLLSSKVALMLLLLFAIAMATATFIENDFGTEAARQIVYNSWWFEILLIWLCLSFILHFFTYKLYLKNNWAIGLFHIAFVLIIIGAGVTRYWSNEGIIHLREGESSNIFFSQKKCFQIKKISSVSPILAKPINIPSFNFKPEKHTISYLNQSFTVDFKNYIPNAILDIQKGKDTLFEVSVAIGKEGREDFIIKNGDDLSLKNIVLSTKENPHASIKIIKNNNKWELFSKIKLQVMNMATQDIGVVHSNEKVPLQLRSLYQWEGGAFVIKSIHEQSKLNYKTSTSHKKEDLPNITHYTITTENGEQVAEHFVKMVSFSPDWISFNLNNEYYMATYGPAKIKLPFQLELIDFDMQRYPGSQSPSGYSSHVNVREDNKIWKHEIFMNNVLDHKGFRFYQSSYDDDEEGTILSVNQDRLGTGITYMGYMLLTIGMFFGFFSKNGRFKYLNRKLKSIKKNRLSVLILLIGSLNIYSQQPVTRDIIVVPEEISSEYGRLIVQDLDGRMKPINTLANEITRKIIGRSQVILPTKTGEIKLNGEQFILAAQLDPVGFGYLPILKIDQEKLSSIFKIINKKPSPKLAFNDLINLGGNYKLQNEIDRVNKTKPAERNDYDKELLKLDERFNIYYGLLTGDFLKLFPNRKDKNNTWFTSQDYREGFDEEDAIFIQNITPMFLQAIEKGLNSNNFSDAKEALMYLRVYQQKAGAAVYPSEQNINAEILYNKLNIGNRLFGWFWILGTILLIIAIIKIFKEFSILNKIWNLGNVLAWIGWVLFTFHLLLRWYIAKYPPWSDGFEMMVFVAWGVLLTGMLLRKKSSFTLPLGILFSGTLLFVSFLDWLNPEITNLMPVLHSYWLKIHVAIIVLGYAPLALAAILSLLTLLLIIFKPKKVSKNWFKSIKEIIIVNEISIMIGLFLFTIGTFLGGVWANESWGRYWAWDPKETWALISVIVYSIILHFRLIPILKNSFIFTLASVWGFSSIIMTSYGVNYYLSGLHSYAKGDPIPVPIWVYVSIIILLLITILSISRFSKLSEKEKKKIQV